VRRANSVISTTPTPRITANRRRNYACAKSGYNQGEKSVVTAMIGGEKLESLAVE
jgi:hypothetical protein